MIGNWMASWTDTDVSGVTDTHAYGKLPALQSESQVIPKVLWHD